MSAVVDPTHRPLGMESDLANPNFAGARNPDDLLWVQFSMKPIQNNFLSQKENRPIFEDQLWIEIRVPGNALTIIERPAVESDKRRFPRQWAWFEQTHGKDGQNIGTPLAQWPLLRPSQVEELRAQKFYTVEQVAFASDEQMRIMGMGPGMSPAAFRERAKLYLETAKDNAQAVKKEEEIKKRDQEIADLKAQMASIQQRLTAPAPVVVPIKATDPDRDALADKYKAKFGKRPHPAMSTEKLREKVA